MGELVNGFIIFLYFTFHPVLAVRVQDPTSNCSQVVRWELELEVQQTKLLLLTGRLRSGELQGSCLQYTAQASRISCRAVRI